MIKYADGDDTAQNSWEQKMIYVPKRPAYRCSCRASDENRIKFRTARAMH